MSSIPFIWCWWWDVQSSVNLTPLTDQQRRATATQCGFQMHSICCTKCKSPTNKKRPEGLFACVRQNLVFEPFFEIVSDDKFFLYIKNNN